jgi:hypothetical protein
MHNIFCDITQKASELACGQLAQTCPSALLENLACLLESASLDNCRTIASEVCKQFLVECPKVWLRQYALPVIAVTGVVAVSMMCCNRPRI